MMDRWMTTLALILALLLAGCASGEPAPEEPGAEEPMPVPGEEEMPPAEEEVPPAEEGETPEDPAQDEPPAPEEETPEMPEPEQQPEDEWTKRMNEFLNKHKVAEEEQEYLAQENYRLAERWYAEGKLETAEMYAREALKHNPNHAGARALLVETQILLGRGPENDRSYHLRQAINQQMARQKQILLEINEKFNKGMRHYNAGQYEDAQRSFRMIIEYSKWVFPPSVEVDTRRQQAVEMLEKTKQGIIQRDLDEQRLRRRLIEEEESIATTSKLIEQKKEMEILFAQAQLHFEREEFADCILICDKLLYMNPNLSSVREMKMVAQRLKMLKIDQRNMDTYIYQWKKLQNFLEWVGSAPADLVEFPDFDTWMQIRKRRPRTLRLEEDDSMSDRDRGIVEKLQAMKFTFNWEDQPLSDVVEFLREATGLNFIFDGDADDTVEVTFKVKDISIDSLLRYILSPNDMTYFVEDGIVHISDTSTYALRLVKLEVFDVQDITFRLLDMPGREITFGDEGVQFVEQPAEAQPQFGGEDLVQLIRDTVEPASWDLDERDIFFQNGLLIVRATADVMKKISRFLTMLRGSTGIMVACEARFLFVDDNWMQQVGIDFRDLAAPPLVGDIPGIIPPNTTGFSFLGPFPYFIPGQIPGGTGTATSSGIETFIDGTNADAIVAARIQNLMYQDFLRNKFFQDILAPIGGGFFQYTLSDDISLNALIRLVSKKLRGWIISAPRITMFNTQRAHIQISNQMAYIRDWNINGGGFVVLPDPVVDVISDGIILDCKPIVSADRKYITMEVRATAALLWPPPPQITQIRHRFTSLVTPIPFVTVELPFVRMQKIKTTVVVPDGGVLLIGGIHGYFDAHFESGVPIWKHVPILGQLGKQEIRGKGRKQIMVLIRADIVIPTREEQKRFD